MDGYINLLLFMKNYLWIVQKIWGREFSESQMEYPNALFQNSVDTAR